MLFPLLDQQNSCPALLTLDGLVVGRECRDGKYAALRLEQGVTTTGLGVHLQDSNQHTFSHKLHCPPGGCHYADILISTQLQQQQSIQPVVLHVWFPTYYCFCWHWYYVLGIMASQRPPSGVGRPMSRSGSVVHGAGRPPTAIRPPPTAIRVATGVSLHQFSFEMTVPIHWRYFVLAKSGQIIN